MKIPLIVHSFFKRNLYKIVCAFTSSFMMTTIMVAVLLPVAWAVAGHRSFPRR